MKFQTYLGSRGYTYSSQQSLIANSVESNSLTVIKNGHSVGTTFALASFIAYYLENTEYNVILVAPNYQVSQDTVLRDFQIIAGKSTGEFRSRISVHSSPNSEYRATRFTGDHLKTLLIFTEADGISEVMHEYIKNMSHPKTKIIVQGNPISIKPNLLRYVDKGYYWKPYAPNNLTLSSIHHENVYADGLGKTRPIPQNDLQASWVYRMISEKCSVKQSEQYSTEENFCYKGIYYRPKEDSEFKPRVLGLWSDEKIPLSM